MVGERFDCDSLERQAYTTPRNSAIVVVVFDESHLALVE
jgi:hypothetical protein